MIMGGNKIVPLTDEQAKSEAAKDNYFEFHIKPITEKGWTPETIAEYQKILETFCGAELDEHKNKVPVYVALAAQVNVGWGLAFRSYRRGRPKAIAMFYKLLDSLEKSGFKKKPNKKPLHEYSCYESKPELDKDWLSHAIIDKTLNDWPNAEQLENREGLAATVEETVKIERK